MSTVLIRQIPDDYAESSGLAKYNRSRMPGCIDRFPAVLNTDGRYITGLDEDSSTVKQEERKTIKEKRLRLESKLGKDLSALSNFWEDYYVVIDTNKPKVFNTENPADELSLTVLIANNFVAPSKSHTDMPEYRTAQYYAYTEESEIQEETSNQRVRDKAISKLSEIGEDEDKMRLYGQYLEGLKYHAKLGPNALYTMLRSYIEDKKSGVENSKQFLLALDKPIEEIQQKILIDKGIKQGFIRKVSLGGRKFVYQFGQVSVGSTIGDVYKNLSSVEFAPELLALQKELEK